MAHTMQIGDDLDRLAEEEGLARSAAVGDGNAFATLYDRYEARIFNYCHRLDGSGEDAADATEAAFLDVLQRLPRPDEGRELNFAAHLFTAARKASYDMIGSRADAEPVDEATEPPAVGADGLAAGALKEDPERAALLASFEEDVRAASARLPDHHREVLALRELDELSYEDIAGIMGMDRRSVAELMSLARIELRDELRGSALAAGAGSSPECQRALPLVSMRQDGQLSDGEDGAWLDAHLASCDTCRASVEAIEEAGVSYRAWAPAVPLAWLRESTIARAGELVGADWSEVARTPRDGEREEASGYAHEPEGDELLYEQEENELPYEPEGDQPRHWRASRHPVAATAPLFAHRGRWEEEHDNRTAQGEWEAAPAVVDEEERRRRLAALIGGIVLLLVLIGLIAFVLAGGSEPKKVGPGPKKPASAPASTAGAQGVVAAPAPAPGPGKAKAAKRKRRERSDGGAVVPGAGSGAGGGTASGSGPAPTPQPTSPSAPADEVPATPSDPDPVDPSPTNTTPDPDSDPDPAPVPDPAPAQPPTAGTPPSSPGSPPSSPPGGSSPGGP